VEMSERDIVIEPRDPVIFRDGKPFSAGLCSRTTAWPLPSAITGAIRTRLARTIGYDQVTVDRLKQVEHTGPVLVVEDGKGSWIPAFPAPADVVAFESPGDGVELRPLRPAQSKEGEGANYPPGGLHPLLMQGWREEKPSEGAAGFWTSAFTLEWLAHTGAGHFTRQPRGIRFEFPERHKRMHVSINPGTQVAEDRMLFATEGLEFGGRGLRKAIGARIRYDGRRWPAIESVAPLGGERRLACWYEQPILWPEAIEGLKELARVRLQLVTPACFREGWKPGWLETGLVPGCEGLRLRLIAAAVPRATAISGWDFTKNSLQDNPRATRFLAPAGSVYFFEKVEGDPSALWLKSISDSEQDRRDGFGLVLCGGWEWL
jgi:CRISPR-associated protein Cmr3